MEQRPHLLAWTSAIAFVVAACQDETLAPPSNSDSELRSHEQSSSLSKEDQEWAALQRDLEALGKLPPDAEEVTPWTWGRIGGMPSPEPPTIRGGAMTVAGRLPWEVVKRIVRRGEGPVRACYENGLRNNPLLAGTVFVDFTIDRAGSVSSVSGSDTTIPDSVLVECVTTAFGALTFPAPESGIVKVTYPIRFNPGDRSLASTLQGKALTSVTWEDLKSALEKAGCTDVEKIAAPGAPSTRSPARARKDGRSVTILLINGEALNRAEIQSLERAGLVFEHERFLLAISIDSDPDKSAAKRLLDELMVKS